jgi:hypothetical protein
VEIQRVRQLVERMRDGRNEGYEGRIACAYVLAALDAAERERDAAERLAATLASSLADAEGETESEMTHEYRVAWLVIERGFDIGGCFSDRWRDAVRAAALPGEGADNG